MLSVCLGNLDAAKQARIPDAARAEHVRDLKFGNIFSINVGPNYQGRIRDVDAKTLKKVGAMIISKNPD